LAGDINKNLAVALLETVKTDASKKLIEAIKQDKQHDGCNCAIGDKKCASCNHVEEKKEDERPFEIKNPPKGEQLGLF
jgi:TPP-dependent indolepyruvate ferredoxin oxidoreductase alpha subunit